MCQSRSLNQLSSGKRSLILQEEDLGRLNVRYQVMFRISRPSNTCLTHPWMTFAPRLITAWTLETDFSLTIRRLSISMTMEKASKSNCKKEVLFRVVRRWGPFVRLTTRDQPQNQQAESIKKQFKQKTSKLMTRIRNRLQLRTKTLKKLPRQWLTSRTQKIAIPNSNAFWRMWSRLSRQNTISTSRQLGLR